MREQARGATDGGGGGVGDGQAEGLSAIGDAGQAAMLLTPDMDGLESSQLKGSYVEDLLYPGGNRF